MILDLDFMDWRRATRGSCSVPIVVVLILRIDTVKALVGLSVYYYLARRLNLAGRFLRSMGVDPQTSTAGSWDDSGFDST